MKTRSLFFTLVLLLSAFPSLFAKVVEKDMARMVATNFLMERIVNHQLPLSASSLNLIELTSKEVNGKPAYFVFSNNGNGFIIISAEDQLVPVIGYSFPGSFPAPGVSAEFDYYLQNFADQVEFVRNHPETSVPEIQNQWNSYNNVKGDYSVQSTNDIGPLITATWDQPTPYNVECPVDASSSDGHVLTGCVATAMSMIMYYYRYPVHGIGTHTYNCPPYGTLSVNYGTTYYDWDGMIDQLNSNSGQCIPAVAQLIYHAGVSVNMSYGPQASGAYSTDVPNALISHFGYSTSTQYLGRSSYSATTWENMVVEQLDALKPIYYSGVDPTPVTGGGHAWICDGYQVTGSTKMFHFNFGWSGYGNGYYTLANPYGFTTQQAMIRNIIPNVNYPYGCSSRVITDANGSFEDGSSLRINYDPNSSCTWLLNPTDSVSYLTLAFTAFNVDPSDTLYIYDGANENAPLINKFTGASIPPSVSSTAGKMFLKFITDASGESAGWTAEYHSVYPSFCAGSTILTAPYGDFSDGSGSNNYNNNATCKWKIQPPYATDLTLSFSSFDLEENDQLLVYSIGTPSTLLATLTGNQIPDPIVSPTSGLLVMFKANGYNTAGGFNAHYTTSNVGVDKLTGISGLSLSPNPAKSYTVLRLASSESSDVNLSISDMTGKQIYAEPLSVQQGSFEKNISLTQMKPGIYMLTLTSEKGKISRKLLVE
ncbi:MAG: C10 family peptidase [Bacteroidetes bacterium]|nr:C10 family peptidase [Bacteroidota bacterium]